MSGDVLIISYAYVCIAKTALACPFYTLYNSYDLVLFWLINMQPHVREAYKMVWLMVMKMSGLVYTCQY